MSLEADEEALLIPDASPRRSVAVPINHAYSTIGFNLAAEDQPGSRLSRSARARNASQPAFRNVGLGSVDRYGGDVIRRRKFGLRSANLLEPPPIDHQVPLKVSACCLAYNFDFERLNESINQRSNNVKILNEEVIYCWLPDWPADASAFVFGSYGSIVAWNLSSIKFSKFQESLLPMANNLLDERDEDSFEYIYGNGPFSVVDGRMIVPIEPNLLLDIRNRLSISYALATSVKLGSFEASIETTIREAQFIPEELATKGKISLSKLDVARKIGMLYMQKSSVNLMYDILDAPDFFWDFDNLRAIYQKCRRMVDIDQRVEVVNMRLDVVRELLEILRAELSEQHGARLEWVVIILIVVEVVLGISSLAFEIRNVLW